MGKMKEQAMPPEGGAQLPTTQTVPTNPVFALVERASADNSIDVQKLHALIEMANTERARLAEIEFEQDMNATQTAIEPVRKDADNDQTHSKYATYKALDEAVRPHYVEHGFNLSFNTEPCEKENTQRVVCWVGHRSGVKRKYMLDMPVVTTGPKGTQFMSLTHATMSAVQYGRRGLLSMIFNVATYQDDDGNAASGYTDTKGYTTTQPPKSKQKPPEKKEPYEIPRPAGIKAVDWGRAYVGQIGLARDKAELAAWKKANATALKDLETAAPQVYDRVVAVEDDVMKNLTAKEETVHSGG